MPRDHQRPRRGPERLPVMRCDVCDQAKPYHLELTVDDDGNLQSENICADCLRGRNEEEDDDADQTA